MHLPALTPHVETAQGTGMAASRQAASHQGVNAENQALWSKHKQNMTALCHLFA